ncbi:MAG: SpaH/EbpB family LPXTG-anchored major pilin [Clostridiales bacterium]|nr:SpaH/EbpB family LPXTG-anchored major pilin [Clostridiales bacterium]
MVKSKYLEKVVAIIMVTMLCLTAVPHVIMAAGPAYALNGTIGSLDTITEEDVDWTTQADGTIKIQLRTSGTGAEFSAYKLLDIEKNGENRLKVSVPGNAQSFWKKYLDTEATVNIGMIKTKLNGFANETEKSNSIVTAFLAGGFDLPDVTATGTVSGTSATLATTFGFYMIRQTKAPAGGYIASAPVLACLPMQKTAGTNSWKSSYTVIPKDDRITITKKVSATGDALKSETIAEIGDTLTYEIVADLATYGSDITSGTITYTLEDTLPDAIEYNNNAVVEFHKKGEPSDTYVSVTGYETVAFDGVDKLSVDLGADYVADFANYDKVKITYTAKFNKSNNIVIEDVGNPNTAKLTYTSAKDETKFIESTAKVYTLELDVTKVEKGNTSNHLEGAVFQVYRTDTEAADPTNAIKFIDISGNPGYESGKHYRVATDAEITAGTNITTDIEVATSPKGEMNIYGLNDQDYHFKEIVAPVGYNIPDELFKIAVQPLAADYAADGSLDFDTTRQAESIQNDSGINLPVTGGMGTILFTAIGLLLMAGAVYFLFGKKKGSH